MDEVQGGFGIDYRLPTEKDRKDIYEYLEEHFRHGEYEIILEQDMLKQDYPGWMGQIHDNAEIGNGDWGRSLLLVCYDHFRLVGILCIRYELTTVLEEMYGHIGYGVRPTERRKGYATQMLRYALAVCREKGMTRAVLGCHRENIASASVIEKCGGIRTRMTKDADGIVNQYYEIRI